MDVGLLKLWQTSSHLTKAKKKPTGNSLFLCNRSLFLFLYVHVSLEAIHYDNLSLAAFSLFHSLSLSFTLSLSHYSLTVFLSSNQQGSRPKHQTTQQPSDGQIRSDLVSWQLWRGRVTLLLKNKRKCMCMSVCVMKQRNSMRSSP